MINTTSATLAVMRRVGGRPTLDRWLALNACDPSAPLDAELLEIVPECLRSELEDTPPVPESLPRHRRSYPSNRVRDGSRRATLQYSR
jgi:hypothetical protein